MENIDEEYKQEYKHYWETKRFLEIEELDRWLYFPF